MLNDKTSNVLEKSAHDLLDFVSIVYHFIIERTPLESERTSVRSRPLPGSKEGLLRSEGAQRGVHRKIVVSI